jgi:hypothetical protein
LKTGDERDRKALAMLYAGYTPENEAYLNRAMTLVKEMAMKSIKEK